MRLISALAIGMIFMFSVISCDDGEGEITKVISPSPSSAVTITVRETPSPTPSPTLSPTPTPTPTPTSLTIDSSFATQGGFVIASLDDPPSGLAVVFTIAGQSQPAANERERLFAVIGLPVDLLPGAYQLAANVGGEVIADALVTVTATDFLDDFVELPASSTNLLVDAEAIEIERQVLKGAHLRFTPERLWWGAWLMPVEASITSPFGTRRSINGGALTPHTGVDFAASFGDLVVAPSAGTVVFTKELYLRGGSVIIDHGGGVLSGYHHLSEILVIEGQKVAAGELIALVGGTGLVSGPHLHWEVAINGVLTDPMMWTLRSLAP